MRIGIGPVDRLEGEELRRVGAVGSTEVLLRCDAGIQQVDLPARAPDDLRVHR